MKDITTLFREVSIKDLEANILTHGTLTSLIDVCGFFLCRRGWVKVMLDNQEYLIKENDVYIYTPSSYISIIGRSEDLEGSVVKCTLELILPFLERSINPANILMLREHPCTTLTPEQLKRIEAITNLVVDRQTEYEKLPNHDAKSSILFQQVMSLAEAFFHELLYAYFCNQDVDAKPQGGKDRVFQHFMLLLMNNYKKEREVAYYAQELCLSPRYFSTVVKETSGHTASEWIIRVVINHISQMLTRSQKSIKEIAMEFNFPSQSFFGKYFKQYTGMSPREFRKVRS